MVEFGSVDAIALFEVDFRREVEMSIRESSIVREKNEEHDLYLAQKSVVVSDGLSPRHCGVLDF
jgi:hypothetical protein